MKNITLTLFFLSLLIAPQVSYSQEEKTSDALSQKDNSSGEYGSFTDRRDGNVYRTIQIGEQIWMADNMKFKTPYESWAYNLSDSNANKYGLLYTWKSAILACPGGWKLPSDTDWYQLINHLGGVEEAGRKLLNIESGGWFESDNSSFNESGFSALLAGYRGTSGNFLDKDVLTFYWTSTPENDFFAWTYGLYVNYNGMYRNLSSKGFAASVRCLKEEEK